MEKIEFYLKKNEEAFEKNFISVSEYEYFKEKLEKEKEKISKVKNKELTEEQEKQMLFVKQTTNSLIDYLNEFRYSENTCTEGRRNARIAVENFEAASMRAVKAITSNF